LPFGQLLSFTLPAFPFTIYLLDIIVIFVFVFLVLSRRRKEIFSGPIFKPLIIFLSVATLSLFINLKEATPLSIFYLIRLITYPSLFFAARFIGFARLKKPLLISITIFSLIGLLQYLIFPDMRFLKNLGFDDHYFRLIGSLYDPNFTGAIFAGVALYFIGTNKIIYSLPFIVLLAPTVSRASYFVFLVGLIAHLFTAKRIKLFFLLVLLGVLVYLIPKPFGEGVNLLRIFSIFSRIDSAKQGFELFLEKPLFGWGYNTLRAADGSRFQIDNSFIFLLATTGMVGFTSFGYLLYRLYKYLFSSGVKLLFLAILIHSLFNNTLFYIWIMAFIWLALAIGSEKTKAYKPA
jgi:O-antigen ligase